MKLLEEIRADRQILSDRLTTASKVREKVGQLDIERKQLGESLKLISPKILSSVENYQSQLKKAEPDVRLIFELRKWLVEVSEFVSLLSEFQRIFGSDPPMTSQDDNENSHWHRPSRQISELYKIITAITDTAALQLQLLQ